MPEKRDAEIRSETVCFRLTVRQRQALEEVAKAERRSVSQWVQLLIARELERVGRPERRTGR